jgi:hypothetical protein
MEIIESCIRGNMLASSINLTLPQATLHPTGTRALTSFAVDPLWQQIQVNIPNSDCSIDFSNFNP